MTIDITNFNYEGQQWNLVKQDYREKLFRHIDNLPETQPKLCELLYCLSQFLSSNGRYNGLYEGELKDRIYLLSKQSPKDVAAVIQLSAFKGNTKLSEVITKVDYLVKKRFFSSWKNGFVTNTRLSHHLYKTLGSLDQTKMSRGMTYFIAGTGLILMGGFPDFSQPDNTDQSSQIKSWSTLGAGSILVGAPFIGSLIAAGRDNP